MTFSTWSQTAASNTAVGGISTDGNVTLVNQIDNMFRGMMAELAVARDDGTIIAVYPRKYKDGLILSNNAGDVTNDIDISSGECVAADSPYWRMALASALTKRLDAAWAVGTGNGGLDTGAIADTTYHVWLIQRSDTGVVDALFSVSATSPTMPTNYDRKRRIGSIVRGAGAILLFNQVSPNKFVFSSPRTVRNNTAALASSLLSTGVPTGIQCEPLLQTRLDWNASSNASINFGSAAAGSANINVYLVGGASAGNNFVSHYGGFLTNTSGQLYFSQTIGGGSLTVGIILCFGWIDSFL